MADAEEPTPDLTPEQKNIKKLVNEYGGDNLKAFTTPRGMIVVKKPAHGDYERFQEKLAGDKANKASVLKELCYVSCVSHSQTELREIFEEYPALPLNIGNTLATLAGSDIEAESLKA